MKLVYVASPLRGDYEANIEKAEEYCRIASDKGVIAFAPHLYFTRFYDDTILEQREQGLKMGLEMLSKADELWVMGKKITKGMMGEINHARDNGIPIFMVDDPHDPTRYPVSTDGSMLLDCHSCIKDSNGMDYDKQILVLRYDVLKEECRNLPNQLWMAMGGFGCSPTARGRRVFVKSIADGEETSFYRQDFVGIVKPEILSKANQTCNLFIQDENGWNANETACHEDKEEEEH